MNEYSRFSSLHNGISDAAYRLNEFVRKRIIDLYPQVPDVYINNIGRTVETLIPHVFHDHGSRKNTPGVGDQVFQQRVLLRCQVDPSARALDLLRKAIQLQILHANHAAAAHRTAAQQCLHAHQEFGESERLGEVIVGSSFEIAHLVGDGIARGEDEHGNVRVLLPNTTEHFAAVQFGQHQIKDDEVIVIGRG